MLKKHKIQSENLKGQKKHFKVHSAEHSCTGIELQKKHATKMWLPGNFEKV